MWSPTAERGIDGAASGIAFRHISADPSAPLHFTTRTLHRSEQFDAYRSFCAAAIELSLPEGGAGGFPADHTAWDLGSLALTCALLPGPPAVRRWRHLRRDPLDHWCIVVAGDAASPANRLIGFRSLARPFEGQASDSRVLSLFIPRELFGPEAALLDRLPPELPDSGLGRVLGDHVESLAQHAPLLAPSEIPGIAAATRALLAACLLPSANRFAAAGEPIVATLRERARREVHRHIRSPALGPELLCRELGVSRSRLYRLFEPLGGVMRYIQRQRLLAAHSALSDAGGGRHIVQIAESVGFTDASGFSRAFKAEFGATPREVREAAHAGLPQAPAPGRPPVDRLADLGDLLRGLCG